MPGVGNRTGPHAGVWARAMWRGARQRAGGRGRYANEAVDHPNGAL